MCVTVGQTSVLGHGTQESHTLNLREEHHRREKNTIDEFVINTYNTTTNISCGGQSQASPHSPHKPLLVVSHSTCSLRSSSPHAHSFVLGTAVINNNIKQAVLSAPPMGGLQMCVTGRLVHTGLGTSSLVDDDAFYLFLPKQTQ